MEDNTQKVNQLYQMGEKELAFMLMLGQHECNFRIFGTIGSELTDDMKIKTFVETFVLIESLKDVESLKVLALRHHFNPQIKYKCFLFNIDDKELYNEMVNIRWKLGDAEFAKYIDNLNPFYFKWNTKTL